jgi:hypothetical protein
MSAKDKAKMIATIAMWLMGIVITVSAMSRDFLGTPIPEQNMVWLAISPLVIAVLGTFMLWVVPELDSTEAASKTEQSIGKAKRQQGDKLSLLLELMDDDERQAFKQLLKQQVLEETGYADGELPYGGDTLESLLNEDTGQRARR